MEKKKIVDENILTQDIINEHKIASYGSYDFIYNKKNAIWEQLDGVETMLQIKEYLEKKGYIYRVHNIRTIYENIKISSISNGKKLFQNMSYDDKFLSRFSTSILFKDGYFDCINQEFHEYKEEDYILGDQVLDWNFKDIFQGDCKDSENIKSTINNINPKKWRKFLNDMFEGNNEKITLMQEWIAYSLSSSTSQQKALIMVGNGSNGKSTIIKVLSKLLGNNKISYKSLSALNARFGMNAIVNKYANVTQEMSRKDVLDEAFKSITGGDSLTNEKKFENDYSFKPIVKLWFLTNFLPQLYDVGGYAILRRLHIFKLNITFTPIPGFEEELHKEIKEIFIWAIAGAIRLINQGSFTKVKEIDDLVKKYINDYDIEYQYIKEYYLKKMINPKYKVLRTKFWEDYKIFCKSENLNPNKKNFLFSHVINNNFAYQFKTNGEWYFKFNEEKFEDDINELTSTNSKINGNPINESIDLDKNTIAKNEAKVEIEEIVDEDIELIELEDN